MDNQHGANKAEKKLECFAFEIMHQWLAGHFYFKYQHNSMYTENYILGKKTFIYLKKI